MRYDPSDICKALERLIKLKDLQPAPDPDNPDHIITHCNQFVQRFLNLVGIHNLDNMMAREMALYLASKDGYTPKASAESAGWFSCPPFEAFHRAGMGEIVVAATPGPAPESGKDAHGHVAIVMPSMEMVYSDKWKAKVPMCANVGKDVFMGKGINYAFKEMPVLYAYGFRGKVFRITEDKPNA